jgi:agmatine/peptidylarginine deiminase
MIPDWQTNKVYFSDHLVKNFPKGHANIEKALKDLQIEPHYLSDTKDVWARDFMPVQIIEDEFIEYRYDPDYLQGKWKSLRGLKSCPDIVCTRNKLPETIKSDLIIDGGNIVKAENTIILTDKVAIENHLTKTEVTKQLKNTFQVDKVVLIPWYKKDKFGHADGMVRFIDETTVLLNDIEKYNKPLIRKLQESRLEIQWLKFDSHKKNKYRWAYLNFLQIENAMLIPKLDHNEDDQALEQLKNIYRTSIDEKRIVQVDVKDIVEKGGGALNCISWTINE